MAVNSKIEESLARITFEHREQQFSHHSYDEDLYQYEFIKNGDMKSVEIGKKMFEGATTGSLSDDPLTNYRYLFVASITLACRFCIEGGMPSEDAFNISDLYIRQMDKCRSVQEIFTLHDTMFRDYTSRMQAIKRREIYSRQVYLCMDYIESHLQQPLTVDTLAEALKKSPSYLSTLFKKQTGIAVSEYIRRKRIDTARMLLQYTEFSCVEIAEYLAFSSDSHFSSVFREYTGMTPKAFRKANYRAHWS
ncbi:MAG: helix-turn-helix transcriptional regulator [Clostridia bacterium]|nr:helix-turn-helix transcriptional regulator [Clostridia bacterium]